MNEVIQNHIKQDIGNIEDKISVLKMIEEDGTIGNCELNCKWLMLIREIISEYRQALKELLNQ